MTDEEMAEEYTDRTRIVDENTRAGTDCISLVQDYEGNYIDIHERIKQAFVAGLKAGKPKWHKVADGDLPTKEKQYLLKFKDGDIHVPYVGIDGNLEPFIITTEGIDFFNDIEKWCEIPEEE